MNILSSSILSADFSKLGEEIQTVSASGSDYIHLDVMDGEFVPNISYGAPVIKSLRKVTDKVFDVHLMIMEPIRYVEDFVKAGADLICVHLEACKDIDATLNKIKEYGVKTGVAVSPDTPIYAVEEVLNKIDMLLIMSVYPGFGGQAFIDASIEKIKEARKMAEEQGLSNLDIEADGGITLENVDSVLKAGANIIVAGSSVFSGNVKENVEAFIEKLNI